MAPIDAAETKMYSLSSYKLQVKKNAGAYISHNVIWQCIFSRPSVLVNTHIFQTPRPQFVMQAFCYKCVIPSPNDSSRDTFSDLIKLDKTW